MAQETAGTIGIPVLRNEVLPYLTDYAKRRERAELYKQKAEQRAAELAAKKAGEMEKYTPPSLETAKGGYWNPYIKKRLEAEKNLAVQRMASAKSPVEKFSIAEDYNTIAKDINYAGDFETQKQKDNLKALQQSGYIADENALSQYYVEQAESNPNFDKVNHIANFKEWVKSRPDKYINPAAIGTNLLKQYEPVSVGIKTKAGKDESFIYNPLFEPERVKDPLTGANIFRAQKPNLIKFEEALKGNENLREAAEAYIQPIANRVKASNPGMSSTEAYTIGLTDFLDKALPQGRAKETYDYSEYKPRTGGGRAGGKTPINITTKNIAVRSLDTPTYSKGPNGVINPTRQQISVGDPKTDEEYTYSRSYQLNPNIPVYLMQAPEDILASQLDISDEATKQKIMNQYLTRRTDGMYTIKTGFEYTNPIKSTVYFADQDIFLRGSNPPATSYTIKKGTPLDNETGLSLIKQGRQKEVKKQQGYEVTAEMAVPYETKKGDVIEKVRPSVKIFIPGKNAGSIMRHIDMEKQKAKSFEAPQTTTDEEVIRF
jgi:hypothetical protein